MAIVRIFLGALLRTVLIRLPWAIWLAVMSGGGWLLLERQYNPDYPALPITLGFPWLGPLGLLPLPVKYRIYFGEPLRFEGDPDDDDAHVEAKVDVVRKAIAAGFERGLAERRGVFR